jgi:hypothetical protein
VSLALGPSFSVQRRADALRDGVLIDVSTVAREAGIRYPVALTRAVWERCVSVPPGFILSRVNARTDLLADFAGSAEQLCKLGLLTLHATLSGPVRPRGDPSLIQWAASVYVHADTLSWLQKVMAWTVAIQAAEAHIMATELADLLGGRPARSPHPRSGLRRFEDDMLDVIDHVVAPAGEGRSRYAGRDMEDAFALVAGVGDPHAASDENGFSVQFAVRGLPFWLEVMTEERNPRLGARPAAPLASPVPHWGRRGGEEGARAERARSQLVHRHALPRVLVSGPERDGGDLCVLPPQRDAGPGLGRDAHPGSPQSRRLGR